MTEKEQDTILFEKKNEIDGIDEKLQIIKLKIVSVHFTTVAHHRRINFCTVYSQGPKRIKYN